MRNLTGRFSFRRGWRGRMILSVELFVEAHGDPVYGPYRRGHNEWRDATEVEAQMLLRRLPNRVDLS